MINLCSPFLTQAQFLSCFCSHVFFFNLKFFFRCIKLLQKQETPTGVELADDEFILHVDGTATTNRVVRHIGGTSWPGLSGIIIIIIIF